MNPSDKFNYETHFSKISQNQHEINLSQLDSLFGTSRLSQQEFLDIFNLFDIRLSQSLNKIQFIYFSHVLSERRKGKQIPFSLPLNLKELFMKNDVKRDVLAAPCKLDDVSKLVDLEANLVSVEKDITRSTIEYNDNLILKSRLAKVEGELKELLALKKTMLDDSNQLVAIHDKLKLIK